MRSSPRSPSLVLEGGSGYGAGVARDRSRARPGRPVPDGRHHLLIPASLATSAVLFYGAHLPFAAVLVVAIAFLALYLLAPSLVRRSMEAFDRDALAIRASGPRATRAPRLSARLDHAWALRLLGAPAELSLRRAMIADEAGLPRAARLEYKKALAAWEGEPPLAALLGHASASYAIREDVDAVVGYQRVLERDSMLPRVHLRLAHATLRAGLPSEGVGPWLAAAERDAEDDDARREVALVRALYDAKSGRDEAARATLRAIPRAPSDEALRDEIEAAIDATSTR